uniref:Secreted protein n=1 Tax=Oryza meridionalis TaxID=40149 RepID=A0A0E0EB59_9ORYZ
MFFPLLKKTCVIQFLFLFFNEFTPVTLMTFGRRPCREKNMPATVKSGEKPGPFPFLLFEFQFPIEFLLFQPNPKHNQSASDSFLRRHRRRRRRRDPARNLTAAAPSLPPDCGIFLESAVVLHE